MSLSTSDEDISSRTSAPDVPPLPLTLKLEARGLVELPPRRRVASNRMRSQAIPSQAWDAAEIAGRLRQLGPLTVAEVSRDRQARARLAAALAEFHYLGFTGTVGENLQYTATDTADRLLGCLLFGSPAWRCAARDRYIGWTDPRRTQHLRLVTNNTRCLILPWVRVPHLASWFLGQTLRRLSRDWEHKYGHPIYLVETFVERERFAGTCYRAANWIRVGATTGRGRQDRHHELEIAVKDVYVYPLRRDFRHRFGQ